ATRVRRLQSPGTCAVSLELAEGIVPVVQVLIPVITEIRVRDIYRIGWGRILLWNAKQKIRLVAHKTWLSGQSGSGQFNKGLRHRRWVATSGQFWLASFYQSFNHNPSAHRQHYF